MDKIFALAFGAAATAAMAFFAEAKAFERRLEEKGEDCSNEWGSCQQLKPTIGDIVEFKRGIYSHFAVYVGDGHVIHLCRPENSETYYFKRETLNYVAQTSLCRINNLGKEANTRGLRKLPDSEILVKAYNKLAQGKGEYDIVNYNCESFATECRYGRAFSVQGTLVDDKPFIKFFSKTFASASGGH